MIPLAVDGVNTVREHRSIYSVWPIFVINNKIPSWMSIKTKHIMLTMIVPDFCLHFHLFFLHNIFCLFIYLYIHIM
jgi:hypothetical protein